MSFLKFPIYRSHLELAQLYWKNFLYPGAKVIDATCGNGKDSLYIGKLVLTETEGKIFCIDIQEKALLKTKELLQKELTVAQFQKISFHQQSFETFPVESNLCDMIVYNLGYLPGGDKSITTKTETTLKSIKRALSQIKEGGIISLSCYVGHKEGEQETLELESFLKTLNPKIYTICRHKFLNRDKAPLLTLIQKGKNL